MCDGPVVKALFYFRNKEKMKEIACDLSMGFHHDLQVINHGYYSQGGYTKSSNLEFHDKKKLELKEGEV